MTASADTIFSKIIRREIPANIIFETETVLAFSDINPQAPKHILVIPKKPLVNLNDAVEADRDILGDLMLAAAKVAKQEGLDNSGYRVVINNGANAYQTVFHLHLHVMGGRSFTWPPG